MANKNSGTGSVAFYSLLCLLFIVLKLAGKVDWSWLLVMAPLWIPLLFLLVIAVVVAILEERLEQMEDYKEKIRIIRGDD